MIPIINRIQDIQEAKFNVSFGEADIPQMSTCITESR